MTMIMVSDLCILLEVSHLGNRTSLAGSFAMIVSSRSASPIPAKKDRSRSKHQRPIEVIEITIKIYFCQGTIRTDQMSREIMYGPIN